MPFRPVNAHLRAALAPEPAPILLRAGFAVLIDIIVVLFVVKAVLAAAGQPTADLTHAALPALFGGMFAFLGSLGGSLKSGLTRAVLLSALSLPLTMLAIHVRDWPIAAGLAMAAAALFTGMLARRGEPLATLGSLILYMYFVPFVFGAGRGVAISYLLLGFGTMVVCTIILRAVVSLVPKHQAPPRMKATDEAFRNPVGHHSRLSFFTDRPLVLEPQLTRLRRMTNRSAVGLGVGALIFAATGDHNSVWVLMTLIALIPPALPLTINRVIQRFAGTFAAMVVLTVIASTVPPGALRWLALAPGLVITITFLRRSYTLSVLGISLVAVLAYSQIKAPLGEALLWRGFDTLVGAVIAVVLTLLMPVGDKPKPVWSTSPSP